MNMGEGNYSSLCGWDEQKAAWLSPFGENVW